MFKKHAVQMTLVKKPKDEKNTTPDEPTKKEFYNYYANVSVELIRESVRGAAILIGTYVAADTARKCVMHIVATKVN